MNIFIFMGEMGLTREIEYDMQSMDFGDGYYASVLTGHPEGTTLWTLSFLVHRDLVYPKRWDHGQFVPFQGRTYSYKFLNPDGTQDTSAPNYHPVSAYNYVYDFFRRHMSQGNTPFLIEDVDAATTGVDAAINYSLRRKFLCRFTSPRLKFTQSTDNRLLYTCSLDFKQVRGWAAPGS